MCDDMDTSVDTSDYDTSDVDTSDFDSSDASYDDSDYDEVPEDIDDINYEDDSSEEIEEISEDTEDIDDEGDVYSDDTEGIPEDIYDSDFQEDDSVDNVEEFPEDVEDTEFNDEPVEDTEEITEDIEDDSSEEAEETDELEDIPEDIEDSDDEAGDDSSEEVVEDTADEAADDSTEEVAEDTADEAADDSTEEVVEDTVDEAADDSTEEIAEDTADEAADDSSEEVVEDTADEAADDSTEEIVKDTADEAADDSTEEVVEDTADQAADDSSEKFVEDTADEATDDSTEEVVEDTVDEAAYDSTEEIAEDTSDEAADDSSEEVEEDTADEAINDTAETNSKDITKAESLSYDTTEDTPQDVQEKTPQQKLSEYMNSHNYGMDDYDTYSQDPEWQKLHSAVFPDDKPESEDESIEHPADDMSFPESVTVEKYFKDIPVDAEEGEKFGNFETDKHINGSEFFVKGDNYEQYKKEYYSPEESTYEKFDEPIEIEISPNDIEGIHISQNDMDNPSLFWGQHETDGSCESFTEIANKIPEVRSQLENGKTMEELIEDPELSKCANIYFKNKPKVVQRDGYYEFDSNGRHRILAAREAGQNIPVEVIGKRENTNKPTDDGTDWSRTSNTPEEEEILREMEENGEIEVPRVTESILDPKQGTINRPTEKHGEIIGNRDSEYFEYIPENPDVIDNMNSYGRNSVEYKDGYPDFSPFTTHETPWGKVDCNVEIPHMTDQRKNPSLEYGEKRAQGTSHEPGNELGNFSQADNEVVKILQKEYPNLTADEFQKYRESNKLTWHECPDGKTMQLVPTDIHNACRHSGGVADMKYRMSWGDITRPNPEE